MTKLASIPSDISQKVKSVKYPLHAAIHKVTNKVPVALTTNKISEVRSEIFTKLKDYETINYIYVVTKSNKLKGVTSIKELFERPPDKKISEIANNKIIKAHPGTDGEKVARMALDANIKAIPIVDNNNNFLGVVPSDQILSILDKEFSQDLMRLAGVITVKGKYEDTSNLSIARSFVRRIPWVIFGLVGGFFAAEVIKSYENVLSQNLILASFIPLVAYIANAVGTQTQTLYIRELVTNPKQKIAGYTIRQLITSTMIALSCSLVVVLIANLLGHSVYLGLVVGLAILSAILTATFFALLIPYILSKTDIDPAVGSGPFTTIIQDLLSILIYFAIASYFF